MIQPSFNFDIPRSRSKDPLSSHRAESSMRKTGMMRSQCKSVWDAMRLYPGRSSKQLAQLTGMDRTMLGRRCSDLQRKGHAVEVRIGKQDMKYWAIVG